MSFQNFSMTRAFLVHSMTPREPQDFLLDSPTFISPKSDHKLRSFPSQNYSGSSHRFSSDRLSISHLFHLLCPLSIPRSPVDSISPLVSRSSLLTSLSSSPFSLLSITIAPPLSNHNQQTFGNYTITHPSIQTQHTPSRYGLSGFTNTHYEKT